MYIINDDDFNLLSLYTDDQCAYYLFNLHLLKATLYVSK